MPDAAPADRPPGSPDPAFWGEPRPRPRRPRRPLPDGPWQRARDLFDVWRADARLGLGVLVVVAVVVGVVWYRIGVGGGTAAPRRGAGAAPAPAAAAGAATTTTTDPRHAIVVHVAGAVATPGVVELPPASRVIDAVEAAGGAVADADLDRLNLAAKVADGERVLVQRVGDPTGAATGEAATGGSDDTGSARGLVNLNTATQRDLEELPGIGPVLAGAIVDERERRGGFRSVQELRDVEGIGEKRFADLADLVTV